MAKDESKRKPLNRWTVLFAGLFLGFVWGTLMWGLVVLTGKDGNGASGWAYIAISMAMIGGGVAALFGALEARKRGERVSPRIRRGSGDDSSS